MGCAGLVCAGRAEVKSANMAKARAGCPIKVGCTRRRAKGAKVAKTTPPYFGNVEGWGELRMLN